MGNYWLDLLEIERYAVELQNHFLGQFFATKDDIFNSWETWFKQRNAEVYATSVMLEVSMTPRNKFYVVTVRPDRSVERWKARLIK